MTQSDKLKEAAEALKFAKEMIKKHFIIPGEELTDALEYIDSTLDALSKDTEQDREWVITPTEIRKLGFEGEGGFSDYVRKFGSCVVALRLNAGKCYCELPSLYVGEIENLYRLKCFLFGLTGRKEFNS